MQHVCCIYNNIHVKNSCGAHRVVHLKRRCALGKPGIISEWVGGRVAAAAPCFSIFRQLTPSVPWEKPVHWNKTRDDVEMYFHNSTLFLIVKGKCLPPRLGHNQCKISSPDPLESHPLCLTWKGVCQREQAFPLPQDFLCLPLHESWVWLGLIGGSGGWYALLSTPTVEQVI